MSLGEQQVEQVGSKKCFLQEARGASAFKAPGPDAWMRG